MLLPSFVFALTVIAAALPSGPGVTVPFVDPTTGGGSWLDDAGDGFGEPMNVVISALSSPDVLTDDGIINFARSLGFSTECPFINMPGIQSANLGDGNGFVNQTVEMREDFGNAQLGTCLESLIGGNHLRVFRQNGTAADTGAIFLAVSDEEDILEQHTIKPNGYDSGRDKLVATASAGTTSFNGVKYSSTATTLSAVMPSGTAGVNHNISIDGNAILLTVTIQ